MKRDLKILSRYKVNAVFAPAAKDMYPDGYRTDVDTKGLSEKLCGASRPDLFRGVTTVVAKLFNIVKPDIAYFGEKDYQQQVIVRKMVNDLNMGVKIVSMPTVREKDGLAMSSRNTYLNKEDRVKALVINRSLKYAKMLVNSGIRSSAKIKAAMTKLMRTASGLKIDYISICDPETLDEKSVIKGKTLIAVAVYIKKTRLIDNIVVN
jgi:pantoate--beta-alanine ligase